MPAKVTIACEEVFSIPELVEKILDHVSTTPLQLFALRRLNSTFNETTDLKKYKPAMFLEPGSRLRLLDLTRVLSAERLRDHIYPFRIGGIYLRDSRLILRLDMDRAYCLKMKNRDVLEWFSGDLAFKKAASWRKVLISPVGRQVQVDLGARITFQYRTGDAPSLGQIVEDTVVQLRKRPDVAPCLYSDFYKVY